VANLTKIQSAQIKLILFSLMKDPVRKEGKFVAFVSPSDNNNEFFKKDLYQLPDSIILASSE
jgi:hypothetical protein